ncbi:Thoeris anti-defense Tad2 family protein [Xenorhabdus bharatensis]|uniref:Thoeris anti-defense Tad2 family protein n=1 Tax=Xenorhabdus bharatensis TaxID=3136256 RepID=UPI0030F39558
MSEVNKLDNKQCPFDLDKYQMKIDNLAPEGSLPWAIIQVYKGKVVARSEWEAPEEYIALTVKNPDSAAHIVKHDKYGMSDWVPMQEELMACDWKLQELTPKPQQADCMLSFYLVVGTGSFSNKEQMWGYLADAEFEPMGEHLGPFGTLSNFQNKTDITKFSLLVWDGKQQKIFIRASSDNNQQGYQKMVELFKKSLTINVNDTAYQLGGSIDSYLYGKHEFEFIGEYGNDNAQRLGNLLQHQNAGDLFPYCFNWK